MSRYRHPLSRIALALLALTSTALASAGTVTWTGPQGGNWADAANWSGGVLPTSGDDVQLGTFDTVITIPATLAHRVTGTGTLQLLSSGNALALSGDSTLGGLTMGMTSGRFTSSANTVITGQLNWRSGNFNGLGTTRVEGSATLDLSSGGVLETGHTLLLNGSNHARADGTGFNALGIGSNARLVNAGNWLDQTSANTTYTNPFAGGLGKFDNTGSFTKATATVTTFAQGVLFANSGAVNVNAGTLRLAGSFSNDGLINVASGAELHGAIANFANAGTLAGTGTVRALTSLRNAGTLAPGGVSQVGTLQLLGNLVNTGTLNVDLTRNVADEFVVGGVATLGGTLGLAVLDGQRLARGSQFTVMSWSARTAGSEFAALDFSQASGYRFATTYGATGLSVTVTGVPFNWTGAAAGGVWDVANNWNSGSDGLPQAGDTVLLGGANTVIRNTRSMGAATVNGTGTLAINSGATLTLSDSASLGGLNHSGTLNNTGRVVVTGASTLSGAILSGAGTTRYEGALAIQGNTSVLQSGQVLEAAGTTTVQGNTVTGLSVSTGARIVNQGTWVDAASANSSVSGNSGTSVFDNQGSFTKTSSTTSTIGGFGLTFNSSGSVNVDAGTLRLVASGASTGQIRIASGATLDFAGSAATFGLNHNVTNAGTFQVGAGVVNAAQGLELGGNTVITNGRLNLAGSSQFDNLSFVGSGTLNNNGTLVVTGPTTWGGSVFSGTGTTRLEGPVALAGASSSALSGGMLVMAGTTTQTGTGGININASSARLVNEGTWLDQASGNTSIGGSGARFDNSGSFTKTGAFTTTIGSFGTAFNNSGNVNVNAGTLSLAGGGASTGRIAIASGATLDFTSSAAYSLNRQVGNAGTFQMRGGIVTAAEGLALGGNTVITNGRLNLAGSSQFDNLAFVGSGTLNNNGTLVVTGPTTWGGSVFSGNGTTRLEGPVALAGASSNTLSGGTLVLAGTTTQTGSGSININTSSARLVNEGTWLDQAGGNTSIGGSGARFDNTGRFIKTGAFTTAIGSFGTAFNNTGTVDVQAGKLQVASGFNNQGLLTVAAGAELHGTVSAFANAGTLAGDGTVRAADRLTNTGTLAAGGLNDAGTLTLLGGLTQQASGTFLVDLGSTEAGGFDLLSISGATTLGGTLAVNLLAGAHFNVGDSFTVMTWNQRLGNSQFASLDLTQAGGYGFEADYGANSLTLRVMTAPVPEPGSWALMAAGLAGLGALQRRRRHAPTTA